MGSYLAPLAGMASQIPDEESRRRLADVLRQRQTAGPATSAIEPYQGQGYRALGPALQPRQQPQLAALSDQPMQPPPPPPDMHPVYQQAAQEGELPIPGVPDQPMGRPPLPQQYQQRLDAMFQPGPLQQRYTQLATEGPGETPHGFLGHLKGAGIGFLLGGLPGAVAGGIAPGIPQRAMYRGVQLPEAARAADQEMQQQGAQRAGFHALAQATGINPVTGEPTLPMLQAQSMMQHRNILDELGYGRLGIQQQRADDYATRTGMYGQNIQSQIQHRGVQEEQGNRRLDQGDVRNDQGAQRLAQQQKAQQFREWAQRQNIDLRRQYNQIISKKGADSPEAQAFQSLVEQGKIDPATGLADNPKYDLEGTKTTYKALGMDDAAATAAAQSYLQRKGIKPKVAATELEEFKGLKAAGVARRGTRQRRSIRGTVTSAQVDDYAKARGITRQQAEAQVQAEGYGIAQ